MIDVRRAVHINIARQEDDVWRKGTYENWYFASEIVSSLYVTDANVDRVPNLSWYRQEFITGCLRGPRGMIDHVGHFYIFSMRPKVSLFSIRKAYLYLQLFDNIQQLSYAMKIKVCGEFPNIAASDGKA